jgi:hypothetical protein
MARDRQRQLLEIDATLRKLADELEREGRADEAGGVVINGYTNGFDDRAPRRVADRKRAWKLQRSHPMLEYQAMLESYKARGLLVMAYAKDAPLRQAYIADTEKLIRKYGERLWPSAFFFLSRVNVANDEFAAGCLALQAFHAFEPSYWDAERWTGLVASYQAGVKRRKGLPGTTRCDLPGIPPPAGS